jgi:hypothetical protein
MELSSSVAIAGGDHSAYEEWCADFNGRRRSYLERTPAEIEADQAKLG